MKRPAALVFDLDGTLVDSRRDIAEALNGTLVAHGRAPLPYERIMPLVGDGARALVARAFGKDDVDREVATFRELYARRPCAHTTLLPGAREMLARCIPCAIVTNKPADITRLVLRGLGIEASFGAVYGGGDGPLKPSPEGVLSVLRQLGVDPRDAWVVGDGPQDVAAGKAAGCLTVGVPGIAARDVLLAAKPDVVVESLHELGGLIDSSEGSP